MCYANEITGYKNMFHMNSGIMMDNIESESVLSWLFLSKDKNIICLSTGYSSIPNTFEDFLESKYEKRLGKHGTSVEVYLNRDCIIKTKNIIEFRMFYYQLANSADPLQLCKERGKCIYISYINNFFIIKHLRVVQTRCFQKFFGTILMR